MSSRPCVRFTPRESYFKRDNTPITKRDNTPIKRDDTPIIIKRDDTPIIIKRDDTPIIIKRDDTPIMIKRLTNNGLQKLIALLLAILAWYVVSISDTSVSQRSLQVPVEVEGLSEAQAQSGAPDLVDVVVSGRSSSVNVLRPENFRASLDLEGFTGEYQQRIVVVPPQDISLVSVSPETAIGTVETINSKDVPIIIALQGQRDPNALLTSVSSVQAVRATGRESVLAQVAGATAVVTATSGESSVSVFATDANGQPVQGITLEPTATTVTVTPTPILHSKTVTLEVSEPEAEGLEVENFSLSQTTLNITGARELLAPLERVSGVLELGEDLEVGEYSLAVTPQLPEGVWGLEPVTATFTLVAVNPLSTSSDDESTNN
jgi:YbbR domain-containing protein